MDPPTTPPRGRLRTPPTPLHGTYHDDFRPYSPPRRSNRSTLKSNPYSTFNANGALKFSSLAVPIPKKVVGPGFTPSDCFSSPPASPVNTPADMSKQSLMPDTPRRIDNSKTDNSAAANNDLLEPMSIVRGYSMLPTPNKTPTLTPHRKHSRAASMQETARVLHFQPDDPNDNMPTRHESRMSTRAAKSRLSHSDFNGLANGLGGGRTDDSAFQIYTESHARVPQLDNSPDNPFYRPRAYTIPPETSPSPPLIRERSAAQIREDREVEAAAARGEGMVFHL